VVAEEIAFTEEQEELRRSIRRFCEDRSPSSEVRRLMATDEGYSPAVWAEMSELGLPGVAIPERFGGAGLGWIELTIVLEEMGRTLCCSPLFATTAMAAPALLASGDEAACAAHLPGIAAGRTIATLALAEETGRWEAAAVRLRAERSASGWTLRGHKSFVVDGTVADVILVAGRSSAGVSLFVVEGNAPGLARSGLPSLDPTRKLARLAFDGVPARLVGAEGAAGPALAHALDLAAVALAAEQVGGAERCLEMSVQYAKVRYQFGRPIGSFQAIKHKCADVLVEVETARAAAELAARAAAQDSDLPAAASLAKAVCADAFFRAAAENIQIHGGIGFTWEHDAHLYYRRAVSGRSFLGDGAYHREQLAQRIGV
jgi:alkylation response protein AidB-like acyl-CoA dehydrogenase